MESSSKRSPPEEELDGHRDKRNKTLIEATKDEPTNLSANDEDKENWNRIQTLVSKDVSYDLDELATKIADLSIEYGGYTGEPKGFKELFDDWMFSFGMYHESCEEALILSERYVNANPNYLMLLDVYSAKGVEELFRKFRIGDSLDFYNALLKIFEVHSDNYDFLLNTIIDCSCPYIDTSIIEMVIKGAPHANVDLMERLLGLLIGPIPAETFVNWLSPINERSFHTQLVYLLCCVDNAVVNDEVILTAIEDSWHPKLVENLAWKHPWLTREIVSIASQCGYDSIAGIRIQRNAFKVINF